MPEDLDSRLRGSSRRNRPRRFRPLGRAALKSWARPTSAPWPRGSVSYPCYRRGLVWFNEVDSAIALGCFSSIQKKEDLEVPTCSNSSSLGSVAKRYSYSPSSRFSLIPHARRLNTRRFHARGDQGQPMRIAGGRRSPGGPSASESLGGAAHRSVSLWFHHIALGTRVLRSGQTRCAKKVFGRNYTHRSHSENIMSIWVQKWSPLHPARLTSQAVHSVCYFFACIQGNSFVTMTVLKPCSSRT